MDKKPSTEEEKRFGLYDEVDELIAYQNRSNRSARFWLMVIMIGAALYLIFILYMVIFMLPKAPCS